MWNAVFWKKTVEDAVIAAAAAVTGLLTADHGLDLITAHDGWAHVGVAALTAAATVLLKAVRTLGGGPAGGDADGS